MESIGTLLADLGKAVGAPAEPNSPRRQSLIGIHAAAALGRRPRVPSTFVSPEGGISAEDSPSRPPARRPSTARRPSMHTSSQHGSRNSLGLSGTDPSDSIHAEAQQRWRSIGRALPRSPSVQAPFTPGRLKAQGRETREGSRFAHLEQQMAVPSWMHGAGVPSAPTGSPSRRASLRKDLASDALSQIGASMDAPQHTSARAAPSQVSAAGDILALSEANLKPPSSQHVRPALDDSSAHRLAADEVREIDKLFTPAPSRRDMAPHHGSGDAVYSSESAMQQLLPRPSDLGYHSQLQQQPLAVDAEAHRAWRPMQETDGWVMDAPVLSGAQSSQLGDLFPSDQRRQHITPLLQRSMLEPASLNELRAAWSSRPIFDPHFSTLRFRDVAGRLLNSMDTWAQAEEQARMTFQ